MSEKPKGTLRVGLLPAMFVMLVLGMGGLGLLAAGVAVWGLVSQSAALSTLYDLQVATREDEIERLVDLSEDFDLSRGCAVVSSQFVVWGTETVSEVPERVFLVGADVHLDSDSLDMTVKATDGAQLLCPLGKGRGKMEFYRYARDYKAPAANGMFPTRGQAQPTEGLDPRLKKYYEEQEREP